MRARFNQSFKIQAVEKAFSRSGDTTLKEVADSLGVGHSTLNRWMVQSRSNEFESMIATKSLRLMPKEKRPQDWNLEDKLKLIVACAPLDDEAVNALCREQGIYPHHIKQWTQDFVGGARAKAVAPSETKKLKYENKALKKELHRKDRALAETAALLVLQKKVQAIWGNSEDDSQ